MSKPTRAEAREALRKRCEDALDMMHATSLKSWNGIDKPLAETILAAISEPDTLSDEGPHPTSLRGQWNELRARRAELEATHARLEREHAALRAVAESAANHLNASYCIPARDVRGTRDDLNVALGEWQVIRTRAG